MLKTAQEVIASGDERTIVDYAIEVNRSINRSQAELEEAKAHLRKLAAERDDGSLSVEIDGNFGVATVKFQTSPEVKVRKGKNLRDVELNLSVKVFSRLFSKKLVVEPVADFETQLSSLSADDQEILSRFVEVKVPTPKVFLTK